MQTVRKYAYLVVIGLVAALVFTNTLSKTILQTTESILPKIGEINHEDLSVGIYVLGLALVLIAYMVVRHAIFGFPRKIRDSVKRLRRRIAILLIVTVFGALFVIV